MRHDTDTPKIQAHQPEIHMDDDFNDQTIAMAYDLATQVIDNALWGQNIKGARLLRARIDIDAVRKRIAARHYQALAQAAEEQK
jgi:hypothetical protein